MVSSLWCFRLTKMCNEVNVWKWVRLRRSGSIMEWYSNPPRNLLKTPERRTNASKPSVVMTGLYSLGTLETERITPNIRNPGQAIRVRGSRQQGQQGQWKRSESRTPIRHCHVIWSSCQMAPLWNSCCVFISETWGEICPISCGKREGLQLGKWKRRQWTLS